MTTSHREKASTIDTWSSQPIPIVPPRWGTVMLWLLGAPALLPLIFMTPAAVLLNGNTAHGAGNDVLGTGGILLLFAMLLITPLRTLTRRQWFVPLRRWYGIVFAFTIFLDAAMASNDPSFNGPIGAKLAGHSFLLLGFTMTLLLIPLCVMGIWNQWTMKSLGKYWKPIQKYGTYAIWGLLAIHLMLLEGFGIEHRDAIGFDHIAVLHQRLYQYAACSLGLLTLRLPPVRRWVRKQQKAERQWAINLAIAPLVILFAVAYGFLLNELFYKGIAAVQLNPIND